MDDTRHNTHRGNGFLDSAPVPGAVHQPAVATCSTCLGGPRRSIFSFSLFAMWLLPRELPPVQRCRVRGIHCTVSNIHGRQGRWTKARGWCRGEWEWRLVQSAQRREICCLELRHVVADCLWKFALSAVYISDVARQLVRCHVERWAHTILCGGGRCWCRGYFARLG